MTGMGPGAKERKGVPMTRRIFPVFLMVIVIALSGCGTQSSEQLAGKAAQSGRVQLTMAAGTAGRDRPG